jgi:hypothetical protein
MYPEKVIMEFANILKEQEDYEFVSNMIETLTQSIASRAIYLKLRSKLFGKASSE